MMRAQAKHRQRGAALIVALAILSILIAIAIAFFSTSRLELRISTNVANSARADMTANAALSIAAAFLNHDLAIHSTYTSLDFAAFTYFNGAWAAGKDWAFPINAEYVSWQSRLNANQPALGTPLIDMDGIRNVGLTEPDGDVLFNDDTAHWLYIPRTQGDGGGAAFTNAGDIIDFTGNFVVDPDFINEFYPKQIIHRWADVDNDGDGWRDSMWIPIPGDIVVGNRDLDGDGVVQEGFDLIGDRIDNNLNNANVGDTLLHINNNGEDDNLDGFGDDGGDGIDELGEVAMFLYRGHADNRDNNGDGQVDEQAEDYIDANGNGQYDPGETRIIFMTAPVDNPQSPSLIDFNAAVSPSFGPFVIEVDSIDNDYDFILNNFDIAVFDRSAFSGTTEQDIISQIYDRSPRTRAMQRIANKYVIGNNIVFATAEPHTEVIGRAAVLVRDVASQVHLNAMGAYRDLHDTAAEPAVFDGSRQPGDLVRAVNEGIAPHEYVSSFLHQVGDDAGRGLWKNLLGAPLGLASTPDNISSELLGAGTANLNNDPSLIGLDVPNLMLDITRPGYGGVDDNGNLLALATNGIDDDGDGIIDEGTNPLYPDLILLGQFEGVDEPGEYRFLQPHRNFLAERDDVDNDFDGFVDELGELGDRVLRDETEAGAAIFNVAEAIANQGPVNLSQFNEWNQTLLTIHSSDKSTVANQRETVQNAGISRPADPNARTAVALKRDYNYATPELIAETLKTSYNYVASAFTRPETITNDPSLWNDGRLARGWRTPYVNFYNTPIGIQTDFDGGGPDLNVFEADGELHANQLAVNTHDFRDSDHAQSRITTTARDDWWNADFGPSLNMGDARDIKFTQAGVESIRINEIMVRPVRRIEAEMLVNFGGLVSPAIGQIASAAAQVANFNPNGFSLFGNLGVLDFRVTQEFLLQSGPETVVGWDTPWEQMNGVNPILLDVDNDPLTTIDRIDTSFGSTSALILDSDVPQVVDSVSGFTLPNCVVFSFRPGPGLPPGRYYLTFNSQKDTRVPDSNTLSNDADRLGPGNVFVVTKYVSDTGVSFNGKTTDDRGILADFRAGTFADFYSSAQAELKTGSRLIIGGPDNGWVFVSTDAQPTGGLRAGYLQDEAYTIEIPPYDSDNDFRLEVAVYLQNPAPGSSFLALNFFDFSQEPDHEWIEIVNIAENPNVITDRDAETTSDDGSGTIAQIKAEFDAIDISGWELEVGTGGEDPIRFTVPENTLIEPGGTLILALGDNDATSIPLTIAFDGFQDEISGLPPYRFPNDFQRNGIGMISADLGLTTPPSIPLRDPLEILGNGVDDDGDGLVDEPFFAELSSPFYVDSDFDDVDINGNGLNDLEELPIGLALPADYVDNDGFTTSYFGATTNAATNAGDRVIFLNTNANNLPITTAPLTDQLAKVAEIVLKGGFLPNYPERDLIDNDGDRDILSSDLIDNDGDGLLDLADNELLSLIDDNNNGIIDRQEGVDEGRWYIRPEASLDSNGIVAGADAVTLADDYERPGSYMIRRSVNSSDGIPMLVDVDESGYIEVSNANERIENPVLVDASPEWKSHIEKRFYPGDAVKVTLYAGPKSSGRIADQVTYTEGDVTNASIHDGVNCPYQRLTSDGLLAAALREDVPGFWPEDSMAVDFYRSLERKHPLYSGDLVGTSNRWEATDGAYDDWDSGRTAQQLAGARWPDTTTPGLADLISLPLSPAMQDAVRLTMHQFNASPLKQNYWQRQVEAHGFHLRDFSQVAEFSYDAGFTDNYSAPKIEDVYDSSILAENIAPYRPSRRFTMNRLATIATDPSGPPPRPRALIFHAARVRNKTLVSPADLATMPMMVLNRYLFDTNPLGGDRSANDSGPKFDGVGSAILGETSPNTHLVAGSVDVASAKAGNPAGAGRRGNDMTALMDAGDTSSIMLSVANADVFHINNAPSHLQWAGTGANDAVPPVTWSPVFLFPITSSQLGVELEEPNDGLDLTISNYIPAPSAITSPARTITPAFFLSSMPDITGAFDGVNGISDPTQSRDVVTLGDHYAARWSLHDRAVMYVAMNDEGFVPSEVDRGNNSVNFSGNHPAEALFMWDAGDGVENGEYDLYIITTDPLDAFENSTLLSTVGARIISRNDTDTPNSFGIDAEVFVDGNGDRRVWDTTISGDYPDQNNLNRGNTPQRSESRGMKQGLIPDYDGVVYYGFVRVENNSIGVLLRNWASGGKLNRVSRVVLSPRRRTRGRININTAQTDYGDRNEFETGPDDRRINPLKGIPGVFANVGQVNIPGTVVFLDPANQGLMYPPPDDPTTKGDDAVSGTNPASDFGIAASIMATRIVAARENFEWPDGRYFLHPSNLLAYGQEQQVNGVNLYNSDWNTGILTLNYPGSVADLDLSDDMYYDIATPFLRGSDNEAVEFTESVVRYKRMANLITTRSDTFEITITAQSGYVSGANIGGDNELDYRFDFVSNGEKKIRVVYER